MLSGAVRKPLQRCVPPMLQVLKCVDKDGDGHVTSRDLMGVLFVPLRNSALPGHRGPEL